MYLSRALPLCFDFSGLESYTENPLRLGNSSSKGADSRVSCHHATLPDEQPCLSWLAPPSASSSQASVTMNCTAPSPPSPQHSPLSSIQRFTPKEWWEEQRKPANWGKEPHVQPLLGKQLLFRAQQQRQDSRLTLSHGRICLARRQRDCSCCCERMLEPPAVPWLAQCFPRCARQPHAAAGKLPATSSLQVSARVGSSLTLSQNFLLYQGCSLVHILGSVYQQGSWPVPWQLQQKRGQIYNCSVYLAKEAAQPKHLCGAERHRAMRSRDRLTLAAQILTTWSLSGMQKESWPGSIDHSLRKQVAVGTSVEKSYLNTYGHLNHIIMFF